MNFMQASFLRGPARSMLQVLHQIDEYVEDGGNLPTGQPKSKKPSVADRAKHLNLLRWPMRLELATAGITMLD